MHMYKYMHTHVQHNTQASMIDRDHTHTTDRPVMINHKLMEDTSTEVENSNLGLFLVKFTERLYFCSLI